MHEKVKNRVIELIKKALEVNEKLHALENAFISQSPTSSDVELRKMNRQLNILVRKERLYLGAAESLLQNI